MRWLPLIMISLLIAGASNAQAQKFEFWDQSVQEIRAECTDYYQRPVLNIRNDSLNDVAFSDLLRHKGVNIGPLIIINYKLLTSLSKASQKFFIAHECGHHALGHLYFRLPGPEAETAADCYAVRTLIRSGEFTFSHIEEVQKDMRKFGRRTVYHLDGNSRADALLKCID